MEILRLTLLISSCGVKKESQHLVNIKSSIHKFLNLSPASYKSNTERNTGRIYTDFLQRTGVIFTPILI